MHVSRFPKLSVSVRHFKSLLSIFNPDHEYALLILGSLTFFCYFAMLLVPNLHTFARSDWRKLWRTLFSIFRHRFGPITSRIKLFSHPIRIIWGIKKEYLRFYYLDRYLDQSYENAIVSLVYGDFIPYNICKVRSWHYTSYRFHNIPQVPSVRYTELRTSNVL
jgi:hypothetical protein